MDVEIAISDMVQTLRLTRPHKKNALTGAMYATLMAALVDGDARADVAAHVIAGSGGIFSAGNDIADFLAEAQKGQGNPAATLPALDFIRALPKVAKPLIACVDGPAIGVGTTLLFHCDLVYASPASVFKTPFLDLGLVPEAGSSVLAPRMLGTHRAFELVVLGETWTAERAAQAGLVNAIVPSNELEAYARGIAMRLAKKPPEALALSRALLKGHADEIIARIDVEARLFIERIHSNEARAAFAHFLAKKPA